MSYSEGGPLNGQISQLVIDTGWIIQRRFQYDRAINLCSYKDWPYAGQSQLDAKIEYSWNFNTFLASEPCRQATITDFMFPVPAHLSVPSNAVNMKAWTWNA